MSLKRIIPLLVLFLFPFFPFIDSSVRYQIHFILITLLVWMFVLLCFPKLKRNIFVFLIFCLFLSLIYLSSIIYGLLFLSVDVVFADATDLFFNIFIIGMVFLGYALSKKWNRTFLRDYIVIFGALLFVNLFFVLIKWLSPLLSNTESIEFLISLYAPDDVINISYWRPTGTIGQAGQFGLAMVFLFSFFLAQSHFERRRKFIVLSLVAFLLVVISGSKTSTAVCLFIFLSYLILLLFLSPNVDILTVRLLKLFASISVIPLFVFIGFMFLSEMKISEGVSFLLFREEPFSTMEFRNRLRAAAFSEVSRSPLFGFGPAKTYFENKVVDSASDLTLRHPDSSMTLMLVRYGIVGLLVWVTWIFYMAWIAFRCFRDINLGHARILGLGVFLTLVGYIFAIFWDPIFNSTTYSTWFFFTFGSILYFIDYQPKINVAL